MESRREFVKKATLLTGALGFSGFIPGAIQRALAIDPTIGTTYLDAEHVVFLMQENRSFDHLYGSLKGVRGFNDPRAVQLPEKVPVWFQSNAKGETYGPFRLGLKNTKATWMSSLPHSWDNQIAARNDGKHNQWLAAKKSGNAEYADLPLTMGYYNREDLPFYYALADAFTVCDHHFCSSLTGTSTNRCFFWTGKIREQQHADSKPHLSNGDIDGAEKISWSTFPERLTKEQIDWKVYQNELSVETALKGEAEEWLGNFTDNTLECFKQYHVKRHPEHREFLKAAGRAAPAPLEELAALQQELHRRAFVTNRDDPHFHELQTVHYESHGETRTLNIPKGDIFHQFRKDVDNGKLPTVSWLVAPAHFSDHPGSPWYGAWYVSEAMDILTKNPEVFKKTIFVLTYDENDGYFDHMPPFVAPKPGDSSTGLVSESLDISTEYVTKQHQQTESPVGLGYRVPMVVVSPWSRGGYVNSQVFDHTSSIQFLEHFLSRRSGKKIHEDNISSWRRGLCGDLTSIFRPYHGEKVSFPKSLEKHSHVQEIHNARFEKTPDTFNKLDQQALASVIKSPLKNSYLPQQEAGIKPANAIPYELYVQGAYHSHEEHFSMHFTSGNAFFRKRAVAAPFNVYSGTKNWSFTAAPGDTLHYQWPLNTFEQGVYDFKVYSVNGFFRRFKGSAKDPAIQIHLSYQQHDHAPGGDIIVHVERTQKGAKLQLQLHHNAYGYSASQIVLNEQDTAQKISLSFAKSHHWYDFTITDPARPDFMQQFAGHIEMAQESFTDPLMA